jgi:hypothetical protein
MTDPDERGGSAADRRFREELRTRLAEVDREQDADATAAETGTGTGTRAPGRTRTDLVMDWAPLAVAVLAIGAIIGIALYGMNGGDLGPW